MGGDLGHAPRAAGGTDATAFAAEGDEPLVAAGVTARVGEAVSERSAAKVGSEIALHRGGDAPARRIFVLGRGEEGLQVVLDDDAWWGRGLPVQPARGGRRAVGRFSGGEEG